MLLPVAPVRQWLMLSSVAELFCPVLQLICQKTLFLSQHCLHRKEMLLQTIDQRNRKLLIHHLLLRNDYQPKITVTHTITSTRQAKNRFSTNYTNKKANNQLKNQ